MLRKPEYGNLLEDMVLNISGRLYGFSGVLFQNAPGHLVKAWTDGGFQWQLGNIGMDLDHDI